MVAPVASVAVLLASLLASVSAQTWPVSGVGRLASGTREEISFAPSKLLGDVANIADTTSGIQKLSTSLPVSKIYGVNFGNWLIFEPWMAPQEWLNMGGQICSDCSTCRQSEWALGKYLGQAKTNAAFQQHWITWMSQTDVDGIVAAGLNTVRIPLGFWIIEDLVDYKNEYYPQGGLDELIRGLTMFNRAGINVLLDHHALPGVSSINQMFAGNCTSSMRFYSSSDDFNYKRAVTWSIVMTWLSHVHPAFGTVFGIEGVNEPQQDYSLTPGLDRFEKAFVLGVRAAETSLGINCAGAFTAKTITDSITLSALGQSIPIIKRLAAKYGLPTAGVSTLVEAAAGREPMGARFASLNQRQCLTTAFMNRDWQFSKTGATIPNPTSAALGPQLYDSHLYFNFGGVSPDQTPDSYMKTICSLNQLESLSRIGDTPLVYGEWAISTAFTTTTDAFLKQWGDAQKLAYSKGGGWIFWNWKVDPDAQVPEQKMWSYREAIAGGVLHPRPDQYFDSNVCSDYQF